MMSRNQGLIPLHFHQLKLMSKKLPNQIANKLEKLSELLDGIDEARIINSDDPDT
jgi:hypothetical protein